MKSRPQAKITLITSLWHTQGYFVTLLKAPPEPQKKLYYRFNRLWKINWTSTSKIAGVQTLLRAKPEANSSEHTSKSLNSLNMWISIRKRPVLPLQSLDLARCALNDFRPLTDDWIDSIATNAPAQNYNLSWWDLVSVLSLTSPWPWRYF